MAKALAAAVGTRPVFGQGGGLPAGAISVDRAVFGWVGGLPSRAAPVGRALSFQRADAGAPAAHTPEGAAYHIPVMAVEVVTALAVKAGGVYLDGTLGEGGHTLAMLEGSQPDGVVIGIDRDPRSLDVAKRRLCGYGARVVAAQGSYADMRGIASGSGFEAVDGILLDLGFSSRQVDAGGYGLSFQKDEPLDMRYDNTGGTTAADIVNRMTQDELADLIFRYGEERRSRAIARRIVARRPIFTTGQLAQVVASATGGGARRGGRHPATRTFQALRIAVNGELEQLEAGLEAAVELLAPGGRVAVISYHSLEDRIVKRWLERETATCVCPPELPVCVCAHQPQLRMVSRRALRPSDAEKAGNPRSRSARLRVGERVADSTTAPGGPASVVRAAPDVPASDATAVPGAPASVVRAAPGAPSLDATTTPGAPGPVVRAASAVQASDATTATGAPGPVVRAASDVQSLDATTATDVQASGVGAASDRQAPVGATAPGMPGLVVRAAPGAAMPGMKSANSPAGAGPGPAG